MKFSKIKSYAKINLALNVIGKKTNLHKIESIVSFIELHDEVFIRPIHSNNHKIYFKGKFAKNIYKKNTVSCLMKILEKKKILINKKFEIKIIKNIPQKAGLGGGSMNASVLINYFLKKKYISLYKKRLLDLTNSIGSDVILGVIQKNTVLSSSGKIRKFKKNLNLHVLVLKPNFGCSTKNIYSQVKYFSKPLFLRPKKSLFNLDNIKDSKNDLERIVLQKYPTFKRLKLYLDGLPNIIFSRMTGSGSSIIAYFHSKRDVDKAAKKFQRNYSNYWCITSKTI